VRKGVLGFLLESLSQLSERDAPFTSSYCYLLVENLNIQKKKKRKNKSFKSKFVSCASCDVIVWILRRGLGRWHLLSSLLFELLILILASHHDLSLEMDGGLIYTLLRERFKSGILPLGRIPRDCSSAPCHDGFQPLFTEVLISMFHILHQKSWVCGIQIYRKILLCN